MSVQRRVLAAMGNGPLAAKALYELVLAHPSVIDCAVASLLRAGRIERLNGVYRIPGRPMRNPAPRQGSTPGALTHVRSEREIRADLAAQLEQMALRWERQIAADRYCQMPNRFAVYTPVNQSRWEPK